MSRHTHRLNGAQRRRLVLLLAETYGTRCAKCGKPIDIDRRWPDKWSPSVGHQLPASRGGSNDIANLRLEHLHCNTAAKDNLAPVRPIAYESPDAARL